MSALDCVQRGSYVAGVLITTVRLLREAALDDEAECERNATAHRSWRLTEDRRARFVWCAPRERQFARHQLVQENA
jgi:hypothetical protein